MMNERDDCLDSKLRGDRPEKNRIPRRYKGFSVANTARIIKRYASGMMEDKVEVVYEGRIDSLSMASHG
jgi:hypothetical protein